MILDDEDGEREDDTRHLRTPLVSFSWSINVNTASTFPLIRLRVAIDAGQWPKESWLKVKNSSEIQRASKRARMNGTGG